MRDPQHFARFVLEATSRLPKIVCWEQGGPHKSFTWPEMGDDHWREAALVAMDASSIENPTFIEPTPEHDWLFMATRKASSH